MTRFLSRCAVTVLGAVIASAAAVLGAAPASAGHDRIGHEAGRLVSVVNGNDPQRAVGTNFDTVQLTAPAPCDPAASRHVARVVGVIAAEARNQVAADKWAGVNLYAPVAVGLPGPLTVRSRDSWQGLADTMVGGPRRLVPGSYRIELRCQDDLGIEVYEVWTGTVTFTSPKAWKGARAATPQATATGPGEPASPSETADEPSVSPSESAGAASVAPSESAEVRSAEEGSGDNRGSLAQTGATVIAVAALAGLLLLAGAALTVLSRRRRGRPTGSAGA